MREEPHGGDRSYQWYGDESVPRGVFPQSQPGRGVHYQHYQPFGMLDPARRDQNGNWSYHGAQFNYGIDRNDDTSDMRSGYERGALEHVGMATRRQVLRWTDPPRGMYDGHSWPGQSQAPRTPYWAVEERPYRPSAVRGEYGIIMPSGSYARVSGDEYWPNG